MTFNVHDEIVWLTRGRNWGYRFLSLGPLRSKDEAMRVRDAIFATVDREASKTVRGKIRFEDGTLHFYYAQILRDPKMRDESGRLVTHEIIIFKSESVCFSPNDVTQNFCSAVEDYYQDIFNKTTISELSQNVNVEISTKDDCSTLCRDVLLAQHSPQTDDRVGKGRGWKPIYVSILAVLILMSVIHLWQRYSAEHNEQLGGVQLWDGGPYWAECNVGASKPEEYGYYFWWGDAIGYKRNSSDSSWDSVKIGAPFSFSRSNCPNGTWNPGLHSGGIYRSGEGRHFGRPIRAVRDFAE